MHCCMLSKAYMPDTPLHGTIEGGSLLWTSRVEDLQERVDSHGRQEAAVLAYHLAAQRPAVPSRVHWACSSSAGQQAVRSRCPRRASCAHRQ